MADETVSNKGTKGGRTDDQMFKYIESLLHDSDDENQEHIPEHGKFEEQSQSSVSSSLRSESSRPFASPPGRSSGKFSPAVVKTVTVTSQSGFSSSAKVDLIHDISVMEPAENAQKYSMENVLQPENQISMSNAPVECLTSMKTYSSKSSVVVPSCACDALTLSNVIGKLVVNHIPKSSELPLDLDCSRVNCTEDGLNSLETSKPAFSLANDLLLSCDSDSSYMVASPKLSSSSSITSIAQETPEASDSQYQTQEFLTPRSRRKILDSFVSQEIKPEWLIPFEQGWRREIVLRSSYSSRKCDVYYCSPASVKLRSTREISDYQPEETMRNAARTWWGRKTSDLSEGSRDSSPLLSDDASIKKRRSLESPAKGSPAKRYKLLTAALAAAKASPTCGDSGLKVNKQRIKGTLRKNMQPLTSRKRHNLKYVVCESATDADQPTGSSSTTNERSKWRRRLCDFNCPGFRGIAPNLSCSMCMCLFHLRCAGGEASLVKPFVCQNCRSDMAFKNLCDTADKGPPGAVQPSTERDGFEKLPALLVSAMPKLSVRPAVSRRHSSTLIRPPNLFRPLSTTPVAIRLPSGALKRGPPPLIAAPRKLVSATGAPCGQPVLRVTVKQPPVIKQSAGSVVSPFPELRQRPMPVINLRPQEQGMIAVRSQPSHTFSTGFPATAKTLGDPSSTVSTTAADIRTAHQTLQTLPLHSVASRLDVAPVLSSSNVSSRLSVIQPSSAALPRPLLPLPESIARKINMSRPLSLKVGDKTIILSASNIVRTSTGVSVAFPSEFFSQIADNRKNATEIALSSLEQKDNSVVVGEPNSVDDLPKLSVGECTKSVVVVDLPKLSAGPCTKSAVVDDLRKLAVKLSAGECTKSAVVDDISKLSAGECISVSSSFSDISDGPGRRRKCILEMAPFKMLNAGFESLLLIFSYLSISDLLRVSRVCRSWQQMAMHRVLWQTVRLRRLRVVDWRKAAHHFSRVAARHLDLRGMLVTGGPESTWQRLNEDVFREMISVRRLDLCPCPTSVVECAVGSMWRLEQLSAEFILSNDVHTPANLHAIKFSRLTDLRELKLRGVLGLSFQCLYDLQILGKLKKLKTLSLTTLSKVPGVHLKAIGGLEELRVLELGDCYHWDAQTFEPIGNLVNLSTLRLECGGANPDVGLGAALAKLTKLEKLELVRYVLADNLLAVFKFLSQLKFLSVWPSQLDRDFQNGVVNQALISAISDMTCLRQFEWGIVKSTTDMVPVMLSNPSEDIKPFASNACSFYTINDLISQLSRKLPSTKIRIFRVPPA